MADSEQKPPVVEDRNRRSDGRKSEPGAGGPPPPVRGLLAWGVLLGVGLLMWAYYREQAEHREVIDYNPTFIQLVQSNMVAKCEIVRDQTGAQYVQGTLIEATDGTPGGKKFRVNIIDASKDLQILSAHNVPTNVAQPNPYVYTLLSSVLPVLLIFGLLYFLFMRQIRSAGHGALSFGKSRARLLNRDNKKVTFENVAGIDEAKEEVHEIIEFLKDPKRFQTLGGRIPKGVLLMGPPGTGKTLLAKAIAGEANVPFFSISGSDFVEMFVGVGASRVRDMFAEGKKSAPCIIFIDEIDAVGRSRFTGIGGGHDEREQTLNALLVQMDGFETQEGVIILAATNRPDVLDQALLRPGRFDRQIVIDLPTIDGRAAILEMHAKKLKVGNIPDLRRIARGTPGFSGADLENLLNEAALLAARRAKTAIDLKDLEEARDKVKWGRERRSRVLDDKERRVTAIHEAGHALVMQMIPESQPLHKITIIPRGVAYLGATMQLPIKDRYMEGSKELHGMIASLMGGRVAEELFTDDITSGASSDLKESTRIARLMVCNWGMSPLGPQTFGQNEELMFLGRDVQRTQDYSEDTARRIDAEVNRILTGGYNRAKQIIGDNRDKLEMIAKALLERETIDGIEVEEIVKFGRVLDESERVVPAEPAVGNGQGAAVGVTATDAAPTAPASRPPPPPPPPPLPRATETGSLG